MIVSVNIDQTREWRQSGLILQCKCHSASVVCRVARCWSAGARTWLSASVPQWNQKNDLWRNENECQVTGEQLLAQHYLFLHFFKFNSHHDDLSYWPNRLTRRTRKNILLQIKNISRYIWKKILLKVSSIVYCIDLEISGTLDSESK